MMARIATLALMAAATALEAVTIGPKAVPRLVWNASESVPMGLYRVRPAYRLVVTDLVVAFPPEPLATFLADGGYLPHARRANMTAAGAYSQSGRAVARFGQVKCS
jgi:type IV secretory pathway protease TraF